MSSPSCSEDPSCLAPRSFSSLAPWLPTDSGGVSSSQGSQTPFMLSATIQPPCCTGVHSRRPETSLPYSPGTLDLTPTL